MNVLNKNVMKYFFFDYNMVTNLKPSNEIHTSIIISYTEMLNYMYFIRKHILLFKTLCIDVLVIPRSLDALVKELFGNAIKYVTIFSSAGILVTFLVWNLYFPSGKCPVFLKLSTKREKIIQEGWFLVGNFALYSSSDFRQLLLHPGI